MSSNLSNVLKLLKSYSVSLYPNLLFIEMFQYLWCKITIQAIIFVLLEHGKCPSDHYKQNVRKNDLRVLFLLLLWEHIILFDETRDILCWLILNCSFFAEDMKHCSCKNIGKGKVTKDCFHGIIHFIFFIHKAGSFS